MSGMRLFLYLAILYTMEVIWSFERFQIAHLDLPELEGVACRVGPEGVGLPVLAVDLPLHVRHLRATSKDNFQSSYHHQKHSYTQSPVAPRVAPTYPHPEIGMDQLSYATDSGKGN